MAEIKVTELPVATETDFTDNDRFLLIDDGELKQITRLVFESWMQANVQGEKGDQGVAGRDGINGTNGADGQDGADGLSVYQLAVNNGFSGTLQQYLDSLKGAKGDAGTNGTNGWSPLIRTVARGDDIVLQLFDWVSGTGTKPTTTGYLGATGLVANIANAVNIRGLQGIQGIKGDKGDTGEAGADGVDGLTIATITINPDLSIAVEYTDGTEVVSDPPPKQYGWGAYRDGQYGETNPLSIAVGTQRTVPNNAAVINENLPSGVTTFYNSSTQKCVLQDTEGWYEIRVKFKISPSNQPSYINLSMNDGTTNLPYTEDRSLRGDNKIQYVDLVCQQYGNAAMASNGLQVLVTAYDRAISIYDVEFAIAKLI